MVRWPNVLLVDDDPSILRLIATFLTTEGYSVRTASNGREALEILDKELPHYLITDWRMPEMSGVDLCRAVRQRESPHYVFVMMLTAMNSPEEIAEALYAGADEFCTKPLQRGELLARMNAGARVLDLESRLRKQAHTDPLTGLPTRRAFFEVAERERQRAVRSDLPFSVAMVDVDYFKKINDTYGHPVGDEVLRQVGEFLETHRRGTDFICRFGGEEFCCLLNETDEEGAQAWAERIRRQISDLRIRSNNKDIAITASLGVAEWTGDMSGIDALIDMADQALLAAKQSGRDKVVCFNSLRDGKSLVFNDNRGPFQAVTAEVVMSALVASVHESETIGQAAEFFLRFRMNSSPVVDDTGKLVGILSERDIIGVMTDDAVWDLPVSKVMKRNAVCYEADTPAQKICEFFCRAAIRRVIVVKAGVPVGVISRSTILRWYRNWLLARGITGGAESSARASRGMDELRATARIIAEEADHLHNELRTDAESLPMLIGRVSRLQELLNDLLGESQLLVGDGNEVASGHW